jgi:hypothetical protein
MQTLLRLAVCAVPPAYRRFVEFLELPSRLRLVRTLPDLSSLCYGVAVRIRGQDYGFVHTC